MGYRLRRIFGKNPFMIRPSPQPNNFRWRMVVDHVLDTKQPQSLREEPYQDSCRNTKVDSLCMHP